MTLPYFLAKKRGEGGEGGGVRARLNQEIISQIWTIIPVVQYSMVTKSQYLNHKHQIGETK